jgi:hypothetical protein
MSASEKAAEVALQGRAAEFLSIVDTAMLLRRNSPEWRAFRLGMRFQEAEHVRKVADKLKALRGLKRGKAPLQGEAYVKRVLADLEKPCEADDA